MMDKTAENPGPAGDMDPEAFRRYGYQVVDTIAEYLARPEEWPVLPAIEPGHLSSNLPASPPAAPEPMETILQDFQRLIMPATTHWNHPGFFGYFAITGSAAGILAEALAAALNVNAMLWRTGPAATELELRTLDWLRQLIGLPPEMQGIINDTASTSTFYALATARELAPELEMRNRGTAGRPEVPPLRVYCSAEAHSSVDKAAIALGLGLENVRRLETDQQMRLDPAALEAALAEDRAAGRRPLAVVATTGTTSTTAVDPVPELARICGRENIWLHVDAAYGGAAAVLPEHRHVLAGCHLADSIVVNPHKWLFVPVDCSALFMRRPELLRRAFRHTPEYLQAPEQDVTNLMDHGLALGRRFRALKLWFVLRYFGQSGLQDRLRRHLRLASTFSGWVAEAPDFELLAPTNLSVVVFRHRPEGVRSEAVLEEHNTRLLDRVNATGEVFLSHTRVRDRYALRLAVGNLRTTEKHIRRAWDLLAEAAARESP